MAVYKDKKRGTWYTSFLYVDWTGMSNPASVSMLSGERKP